MGEVTQIKPLARGAISAPAPLNKGMHLKDFDCGNEALNNWLHFKSLKSEGHSARTYAVCCDGSVIGYYCFANASVPRSEIPKKNQRNMPITVPATLLGRLAVDRKFHGQGIGSGLLKDGLVRALAASEHVASHTILVHAIDKAATDFYLKWGFVEFPSGSQTLFLPMETVKKLVLAE